MKKLKFSAAFCIAMLLLQGLYAQYTGQASINPDSARVFTRGLAEKPLSLAHESQL